MQDELVAVAANAINGGVGRSRRTEALHVAREITAKRRGGEKLFFGRIETRDTKKRQIGLADERRLAPETYQFSGAAPGEMRDDHAIHASGGGGGGSIEIGVAVHVDHADFAKIAARAGDGGERNGAVTCKNERQRSGFHG